ncbi:MAG: cell division protein FtsQ [Frankiaceae bacterium]|nr:cell division protein FtsQ [Frankiaceae bacterium]MDX6274530.1 cell division protein FtsQ [Frankiales bacterium]
MSRRTPRSSRQRFAARAKAARLQAIRPLVGVLVGAIAVAALGWVVLASGVFSVRAVTVHGAHRMQSAQVVAALGPVKGQALLTLDTTELRHRVEQLSGVRSVQVSRRWPSTVSIRVVERTPIATVHRADGWWLVDSQGVEFGPAGPRPKALREVKLPAPGERSAEAARSAAQVLAALPAPLLSTVTRVEASSADSVRLWLSSGATVVWGSAERSAEKARILATLVHRRAHVYDVSSPSVVTTR